MNHHTPFSPRLVRTAHTKEGTSVFVEDTHITPFSPFGPQASAFAIFDTRQSVPVNNQDATPSFDNVLPRCPPQGAIFVMSEILPGGMAPMHRTQSLDYCVVLSGEIVLALDGGEEKTVRAGEMIVQQGVNHSWMNRSADESCRMLFVMLGSEKVALEDGTVFEETAFKTKP